MILVPLELAFAHLPVVLKGGEPFRKLPAYLISRWLTVDSASDTGVTGPILRDARFEVAIPNAAARDRIRAMFLSDGEGPSTSAFHMIMQSCRLITSCLIVKGVLMKAQKAALKKQIAQDGVTDVSLDAGVAAADIRRILSSVTFQLSTE